MAGAAHPLWAQNLIQNPGLEQYYSCPTGKDQLDSCVAWFGVSGTPDYFHSCATTASEVSVPNNFTGYQLPLNTNGYIGHGYYIDTNDQIYGNEYVRTRLAQPLLAGQRYCFSVKLNLGNITNVYPDRVDFFFSPTVIQNNPPTSNPIWLAPTLSIDISGLDTVNWTTVRDTFVAQGGEQHLAIGLFRPGYEYTYTRLGANPIVFYLISDDYELVVCPERVSVVLPNAFSPNGDGQNEVYFPELVGAVEAKITVFNRWGTVVYEATGNPPQWEGQDLSGNQLAEGVYFVHASAQGLEGDQAEAKRAVHLFR